MLPLEWEVQGEDNKHRVRVILLLALPGVVIGVLDQLQVLEITRVALAILSAILFMLVGLVVNEFFRYPTRRYTLTQYGLHVVRGSWNRIYRWEEFRCFYEVGSLALDARLRQMAQRHDFRVFYLKLNKRRAGLARTFLVIYADPRHAAAVEAALLEHIPKEPWTIFTDFGLVHFEFR